MPSSDSGADGDGITNDTTPTFTGTAPDGSTVKLISTEDVDGTPVTTGQVATAMLRPATGVP